MNKRKLLKAFIIALVLLFSTIVIRIVICLLDCLPKPWNFVANGAILLSLLTFAVYGFISENQSDKEVHAPDYEPKEKKDDGND